MIRRIFPILLTLSVAFAFAFTLVFLYDKSQAKPVTFQTVKPVKQDIVKKAVAPGALVPRREVTIKPRVSGVLEKLYVEAGQRVKERQLLAKIQIIPNVVALNNAESAVRAAQISFDNAQSQLQRYQQLFDQKLMNETEFNQFKVGFELKRQELETAQSNRELVKEGASKRTGKVSNLVNSTVDGMVLDVPVKEGSSVIEANNFNEGTTIAAIADMGDMIFQGRVDESEVGKLREGMPVSITVGALGEERLEGKLEYIAPKGKEKEGTIEFEVKAAVTLKPGVVVRANYSANADIILDTRQNVMAIEESLIQFEKGKAYVEVEGAPQTFSRREVKLGLSDGINVEVLSGLDETTRVKKPLSEAGGEGKVKKP
ncbi:MAG TPA: efflux RND transporter periplasmic adaptor subunit [Polyangiaceae bacterium]|nr:efflux RND transporter periplasmic adaptor subunit [Polyangiaceae bacterium]